MNVLRLVWRELVGLFVDDEFLAIAVLAVVVAAALAGRGASAATALVLVAGLPCVLLASVLRGSRRKRD